MAFLAEIPPKATTRSVWVAIESHEVALLSTSSKPPTTCGSSTSLAP